jgi:hypothetical protein
MAHVARLVAGDLDFCKDPWLIEEEELALTEELEPWISPSKI